MGFILLFFVIFDFSSFLMYVYLFINFPLRTALATSQSFNIFHHNSFENIILISSMISSDNERFRSPLLNVETFKDFQVNLLLLIVSLTMWLSETIFYMIFIL